MSRQSTYTNTDNEDNSLSISDSEKYILEQLIKIQEDSKVKDYLDFTSDVERVTKVKNVLRLSANKEMLETKRYF